MSTKTLPAATHQIAIYNGDRYERSDYTCGQHVTDAVEAAANTRLRTTVGRLPETSATRPDCDRCLTAAARPTVDPDLVDDEAALWAEAGALIGADTCEQLKIAGFVRLHTTRINDWPVEYVWTTLAGTDKVLFTGQYLSYRRYHETRLAAHPVEASQVGPLLRAAGVITATQSAEPRAEVELLRSQLMGAVIQYAAGGDGVAQFAQVQRLAGVLADLAAEGVAR